MTFSFKGFFKEKDERSKRANINTFFMLILRGINIIVSLLYVPLLIHSLSSYKYGVWLTITSIITWLNFFDIGLGNGLRNKLSIALAEKDDEKGRILISTSYFSIGVISIIFVIVFYFVSPFLNWVDILNVDISMSKEVTKTIYIVMILFCVSFVLNIINSILLAFQRPAFSSLIATIGQLFALLLVAYAVKVKHIVSLPFLASIMTIVPIVV
jgi:O-antigen/teichoic acid export membrane protein